MKKKVSNMLLLIAASCILFSSCDKEEEIDPSEIYILYEWTYYEELDETRITGEFQVEYDFLRRVKAPTPWAVTFNGDTTYYSEYGFTYSVLGIADSGTFVYTDVTGANYSIELKPKLVPQIPDTFTSVNHNVSSYFYWEGDSTVQNENVHIMLCNLDSFYCAYFNSGSLSYGIHLRHLDLYLSPGTNNTRVSLGSTKFYNLPTAAPKGGGMDQEVILKEKIISVY